MAKPMTFPHSSVLRLTDEQRERIEEERKREEKIPAFAEMVRTLIDEALDRRQAKERIAQAGRGQHHLTFKEVRSKLPSEGTGQMDDGSGGGAA